MSKEFEGKVALVTGGSRGIGRAIALKLAEKGAHAVISFFRSRDKAEETVREIEKLGVRCISLRTNLKDRANLVKMFETIKNEFGKLDFLIVNAAMGFFSRAVEFPQDKWDLTIESNVTSYYILAREASKLMTGEGNRRGGKIVAITSYGSKRYITGYSAMGVSKASIETLTRYLAVELAESGINANCVSPGPIETDSLKMLPDHQKLVEETVKRTPAGRIGMPEDIAKVVAFLCSDDAEWIRGQIIVADGGMSLL